MSLMALGRPKLKLKGSLLLRFEDVWKAFMKDDQVRKWLFRKEEMTRNEVMKCLEHTQEPLSFTFDPNVSEVQNLQDFGMLSTVMYHHNGVALGVTIGNSDHHPVLPVAYSFTLDDDFFDNRVIVRRCAIRRLTPESGDLIRIQLDWFRSGVLGIDFSIIPSQETQMGGSVGFAKFGHRFFKPTAATALFHQGRSDSPDQRFIDGESCLLTPEEGSVALDGCDMQFKTDCQFCNLRNNVLCFCPELMKNRYNPQAHSQLQGDTTSECQLVPVKKESPKLAKYRSAGSRKEALSVVWNYYAHRVKMAQKKGHFVTNWRHILPGSRSCSQLDIMRHQVPYALVFKDTGTGSKLIQQALLALNVAAGRPPSMPIPGLHQHEQNAYGTGAGATMMHLTEYQQTTNSCATSSSYLYNYGASDSSDTLPTINMTIHSHSQSLTHAQPRYITHTKVEEKIQHMNCTTSNIDAATDALVSLGLQHVVPDKSLQTSPCSDTLPSPPSPALPTVPETALLNAQLLAAHASRAPIVSSAAASAAARLPTCRTVVAKNEMELEIAAAVQLAAAQVLGKQKRTRSPIRKPISGGSRVQKPSANASSGMGASGGGRVWKCDQCGKLIRGKRSNLNRHIANKHEKKRPFACDEDKCTKKFQTRLNLERHKNLVHVGRPERCQFCSRTFKTKEKLIKHVESVHHGNVGDKSFQCPHCSGCYGKQSTLSRHIASVHKDSTNAPNPMHVAPAASPAAASAA